MTAAAPAGSGPRGIGQVGRISAIDAARAVAVLGMIIVNVGPRAGTGLADALHRLPLGRASLLFVLLAGLGISLLTRRSRRPGGRLPWGAVLWRAGLLLIGGLALQMLDHGVSVILPTYAVLFLAALPFIRASDRLVLVAAGVAGMLGPLGWIILQRAQPTTYDVAVLTDAPADILHSVLLSSPYPVITWLGPFLLGMWLGRQDLASRTLQVRLMVVGAVATLGARAVSLALVAWLGEPADAVGFDRLVTSVAHSQMPLWLVSGTGSAVLVIGALLRAGGFVDRWLTPLVHTGQLALTIYVAHLLVLDLLVRPGPYVLAEGVLTSLALSAGAVAFAVLWRRRFDRGLLELLLRPPWTLGGPTRRWRATARRRPFPPPLQLIK